MIAIIFSIAGLILFGISNYFFVLSGTPRIQKILLSILSLIPFIGAVVYFILTIIGIFSHCHLDEHLYNSSCIWNSDKFPVRDTKLNRWLFDDLDWEKYDKIRKFNAKYNTNKE